MLNNKNMHDNVHQLVLPIETKIMIPKDDPVRLPSQIMEGLDYSNLCKAHSAKGKNFLKNKYKFYVAFPGAKAAGQCYYCKISYTRLENCIEDLFNQLIIKLSYLDEIKYRNIFIDETKIEANANKDSFI